MISFKTQVNEKIMEHCRYKQIFFPTVTGITLYTARGPFESISWIYFLFHKTFKKKINKSFFTTSFLIPA